MICLPKEFADKFTAALKSGKIDPEKLSGMTSQGRRDYYGKIVGEADAREINSMFESKMLLKNQKTAYVTWAKQVAGMNPKTRLDIVAKIEKMDKVLNPTEEKAFREDLAAKKLGTDITFEEAQK